MVDIPKEIQIKSTIRTGSVYYFVEETHSSSEPHYFIVLNLDPLSDTVIILVWASHLIKKVKERRKTCPPETLIEITPAQYSEFSVNSIIDCNKWVEKSIDELVNKLSEGKLKLKSEMNIELVSQLRTGVLLSNMVDTRVKNLLRVS